MSNAVTHSSYHPVSQARESMKVNDENQALLDANTQAIVEKGIYDQLLQIKQVAQEESILKMLNFSNGENVKDTEKILLLPIN